MSCAPTSRRGLPLNCRLLVKGIQKASRLLGEASKFATSTVEFMTGSGSVGGGGRLPANGRGHKLGGGLDQHSHWNWLGRQKMKEEPHAQRRTRCGAPF